MLAEKRAELLNLHGKVAKYKDTKNKELYALVVDEVDII